MHLNEEGKKNISEGLKRKWADPEYREKMLKHKYGENNPFFGKHLSEEWKRAHGEVIRARWHDPIWKATKGINVPLFTNGNIPWNKGKPCSPETKEKISKNTKERMKGWTKQAHSAKVLETAQALQESGYRIVFVDDNGPRPDIVCLKDGMVYQVEVEKKDTKSTKHGPNKAPKRSPNCDEMKVIYY